MTNLGYYRGGVQPRIRRTETGWESTYALWGYNSGSVHPNAPIGTHRFALTAVAAAHLAASRVRRTLVRARRRNLGARRDFESRRWHHPQRWWSS
jgi:hypothetical protein